MTGVNFIVSVATETSVIRDVKYQTSQRYSQDFRLFSRRRRAGQDLPTRYPLTWKSSAKHRLDFGAKYAAFSFKLWFFELTAHFLSYFDYLLSILWHFLI